MLKHLYVWVVQPVTRGSGMSHATTASSKTIIKGTSKGGRCRGQQRKCWMDNIKEWTFRKDWKKISAQSSLPTTQSVMGLNWTDIGQQSDLFWGGGRVAVANSGFKNSEYLFKWSTPPQKHRMEQELTRINRALCAKTPLKRTWVALFTPFSVVTVRMLANKKEMHKAKLTKYWWGTVSNEEEWVSEWVSDRVSQSVSQSVSQLALLAPFLHISPS